MTISEFINEHEKVCSKSKPKRQRRTGDDHHGRGMYRSRSVRQVKRNCGRDQYKLQLALGLDPDPALRYPELWEKYHEEILALRKKPDARPA